MTWWYHAAIPPTGLLFLVTVPRENDEANGSVQRPGAPDDGSETWHMNLQTPRCGSVGALQLGGGGVYVPGWPDLSRKPLQRSKRNVSESGFEMRILPAWWSAMRVILVQSVNICTLSCWWATAEDALHLSFWYTVYNLINMRFSGGSQRSTA